jgi:hypothetical protein
MGPCTASSLSSVYQRGNKNIDIWYTNIVVTFGLGQDLHFDFELNSTKFNKRHELYLVYRKNGSSPHTSCCQDLFPNDMIVHVSFPSLLMRARTEYHISWTTFFDLSLQHSSRFGFLGHRWVRASFSNLWARIWVPFKIKRRKRELCQCRVWAHASTGRRNLRQQKCWYNDSTFSARARIPLYRPTASKSPEQAVAPLTGLPLIMKVHTTIEIDVRLCQKRDNSHTQTHPPRHTHFPPFSIIYLFMNWTIRFPLTILTWVELLIVKTLSHLSGVIPTPKVSIINFK